MPTFLLDTSCMIALVSSWHEQRQVAVEAVEDRLRSGQELALAAHSLVEMYSVLTRLPDPHRLSPAEACSIIEGNFLAAAQAVTLEAEDYHALLRDGPRKEIAGGRIYDAVILACAMKVQASALLTFNARHFQPLAPSGLEIVALGAG